MPAGPESDSRYRYVGDELQIFAQAEHWKDYLRSRLARHIRGDVLEVGAGMGGTTRFLCDGTQRSWLCLEPDGGLADALRGLAYSGQLPLRTEVLVGSTSDLHPSRLFDAILYIDVLRSTSSAMAMNWRSSLRGISSPAAGFSSFLQAQLSL